MPALLLWLIGVPISVIILLGKRARKASRKHASSMKARLISLFTALCVPVCAHAEPMVTSHYRAKAPHIAAHRTLPLGTELIITNERNGRTAHVVIGTRGPFIRGRSLDISHARANELGFGSKGVLRLQTRILEKRRSASGANGSGHE
jgi:Lytic transglycolase